MSDPRRAEKSVAEVARRECALLTRLAEANRRISVYRHHSFFRRSRYAVQLAKKCYGGTAAKSPRRGEKRRSAALITAHRALVTAVEHCTAELAASRIDTIALCVAFIAILSRLGCCVGKTILLTCGVAPLSSSCPDSYTRYLEAAVAAQPASSVPRPSPRQVSHDARADRPTREQRSRGSYGDLVNRLVGHAAKKKK
ncbi:hypothetical protein NESM_000360500 [Novymonas esmeraldas]|uniref:Uncharacterized protein n=1 Tax=Novymonas esmeraldas TaxID=1808958 RepID=A0AAW0EL85_9TRYP